MEIKNIDIENDIKLIARIPSVSNMLEVVCSSTGMGFAAIARVTKDRWVACATSDKIGFGLGPGGELKVETTICNEIREHHRVIAIDHVAEDVIYSGHHTPLTYGLQSYISVPIILKNGAFFGTLCAIDPKPAYVNNDKTINMFTLFAELVAFHLDSMMELTEAEKKLKEEQRNTETREQFIAMLGHDLRNPVNAVSNAIQLQLRSNLDEKSLKLGRIIQNSTLRIRGLIDNILDFASGRLGGGITLSYQDSDLLEEALDQVITELRVVHPERLIEVSINLTSPVRVDIRRIAQLFSNLLGNAITHGDANSPITVNAVSRQNKFELCVTNSGNQIPDETLKHLFKPFSRGKVHQGQEGLGLGLYIASEIAKAHQGEIIVDSRPSHTCFTVSIPI